MKLALLVLSATAVFTVACQQGTHTEVRSPPSAKVHISKDLTDNVFESVSHDVEFSEVKQQFMITLIYELKPGAKHPEINCLKIFKGGVVSDNVFTDKYNLPSTEVRAWEISNGYSEFKNPIEGDWKRRGIVSCTMGSIDARRTVAVLVF